MLPKPDQPCKNNIAVITIGNVQVMAGGNPPSKVKLTCGSQWKWNYSAKAGQPNCAAIMTVGNRIKISYDVAESTSFPGTMMKFINEAVPAAPGELDSWDSKEPWTGGNTGSGNSTSRTSPPPRPPRPPVTSTVPRCRCSAPTCCVRSPRFRPVAASTWRPSSMTVTRPSRGQTRRLMPAFQSLMDSAIQSLGAMKVSESEELRAFRL